MTNVLRGARRFSPRRLSGLRLWLAAASIGGLADGDPVSTWSDLSGQGNNATQSTTAAKPLYKVNIAGGRPGVLFDGVDDYLSLAAGACTAMLAGDKSVFTALKWVSVAGAEARALAVANGGGSSRFILRYTTGPGYNILYTTGAAQASITAVSGAQPSTSVAQIFEAVQATASLIGRVNGTQIATDPANAGTEAAGVGALGASPQGSSLFANVHILEVVAYNRALSTAEASLVRRYLGARYGVAVS